MIRICPYLIISKNRLVCDDGIIKILTRMSNYPYELIYYNLYEDGQKCIYWNNENNKCLKIDK